MAKKKNNIQLSEQEFIQLLGSSGHLFPRNEEELKLFDEYYSNYDFKLKDTHIDPNEIIEGTFKVSKKIIQMPSGIDKEEIESLKLAARKGENQIPSHILDKLKEKHKKRDESSD